MLNFEDIKHINPTTGRYRGVRGVPAQAPAGVTMPACDEAWTSRSQPGMSTLQQTIPERDNTEFQAYFGLLIVMAKQFSTNGCL